MAEICSIWDDLKECISWDSRDDMVNASGAWDWDRLETILPRERLERIASVQPPLSGSGEDKPMWRWKDKRNLTTRSPYAFIVHGTELHNTGIWKNIWKILVPQRVRVFVWLTFHERILTKVERVRRHITNSELCGICGGGQEDTEYVLRSCVAAKGVWMRTIPPEVQDVLFTLTFHEWLCMNMFGVSFMSNDVEWSLRFAILCWLLWKRRCRLLLDSEVGVMDDILVHVNRLVKECSRLARTGKNVRVGRMIPSWVRLSSSLEVLTRSALVVSIKRLLNKKLSVVMNHIGREDNRVANILASRGCSMDMSLLNFILPPTDVVRLVVEEERGSSPTIAMPMLVEAEVLFDLDGIG
ncbi:hypothetical protein V6N12_036315 [Hibiscus sabdariffa]|uniref:Reverse transcriptase zinc-binding domain-containing protein n=1 Tax=Hibiscus sabdariffa TaxID=183260 RepID=A0ABR2EQS6_9ROSI